MFISLDAGDVTEQAFRQTLKTKLSSLSFVINKIDILVSTSLSDLDFTLEGGNWYTYSILSK